MERERERGREELQTRAGKNTTLLFYLLGSMSASLLLLPGGQREDGGCDADRRSEQPQTEAQSGSDTEHYTGPRTQRHSLHRSVPLSLPRLSQM